MPLAVTFIDYQKAFDSINSSSMLQALKGQGSMLKKIPKGRTPNSLEMIKLTLFFKSIQ